MTRITDSQRALILRLFMGGTSMQNLATSYKVPLSKIEDIIRAYTAPMVQP